MKNSKYDKLLWAENVIKFAKEKQSKTKGNPMPKYKKNNNAG